MFRDIDEFLSHPLTDNGLHLSDRHNPTLHFEVVTSAQHQSHAAHRDIGPSNLYAIVALPGESSV